MKSASSSWCSLVHWKSPLIVDQEIRNKQSTGSTRWLIDGLISTRDRNFLEAFSEIEKRKHDAVHHPEVHGAWLSETECSVFVEKPHRHTEDFSQNHDWFIDCKINIIIKVINQRLINHFLSFTRETISFNAFCRNQLFSQEFIRYPFFTKVTS